ncbi:PREDICTED: uncharacterized protein LOC109116069 [Tarenaya hassleriana]|uniref:uncharacterized protein LOC109116069 n=1 Tax=Tarenaya hassleriana TaxID=28532 RepID=UPI0008FD2EC8|nr:PREDICTED: uncharacterized protein LOC109116069 [Tarenaya hassleriana]
MKIAQPLHETIAQTPSYEKFLKDGLVRKEKLEEEPVILTAECRASMSLLPKTTYDKLNVDELKPTKMILQLADKSVKALFGTLEDAPLKVENVYVPIDFVAIDVDRR